MVRATDTRTLSLGTRKFLASTDAVAKAVYDKQLLQDKKTLTELSDSEIDSVIRAICWTLPIAKISAARLKLAIFWIKHQDRTQCKIGIPANPLVRVTLETMLLLKTQKQLEDKWRLGNKEPDYPAQTLDMALATKAFNKTRTALSCVRGVTGVPPSYVIPGTLKVTLTVDDPPFGVVNSPYSSIDSELISRATILSADADSSDDDKNSRPMALST
jgi:hypothetical protein